MNVFPHDIYCEIARRVNSGYSIKSWIFTCKNFAHMITDEQIAQYSNHVLIIEVNSVNTINLIKQSVYFL